MATTIRHMSRVLGAAVAAALALTAVLWYLPNATGAQAADRVVELVYTGYPKSIAVPVGASSVSVLLRGGAGASTTPAAEGGAGAHLQAELAVSRGDTLVVTVGGSATGSTGGYNGGGSAHHPDSSAVSGGGGGGATDIRIGGSGLEHRVLVAGGGGGGGTAEGAFGGYSAWEGAEAEASQRRASGR